MNKDTIYKIILKSEIAEEDGSAFPIPLRNIIDDTKIDKCFCAKIVHCGGSFVFELPDTNEQIIIPHHWILFMAPALDKQGEDKKQKTLFAQWKVNPDGYYLYCSNCNTELEINGEFCHKCGAYMINWEIYKGQ